MSTRSIALCAAGFLLAALLVAGRGGLFESAASPLSQTSAAAAAPAGTPTYISEIGTAITIPPREPAQLPASGSAGRSGDPLPLVVGFVLAGSGVLLIHAARTIGHQRPRPAL